MSTARVAVALFLWTPSAPWPLLLLNQFVLDSISQRALTVAAAAALHSIYRWAYSHSRNQDSWCICDFQDTFISFGQGSVFKGLISIQLLETYVEVFTTMAADRGRQRVRWLKCGQAELTRRPHIPQFLVFENHTHSNSFKSEIQLSGRGLASDNMLEPRRRRQSMSPLRSEAHQEMKIPRWRPCVESSRTFCQ